MDEELDPDDGNVNSILTQEYSELLHILCCQSDSVIMQLGQNIPSDAVWFNTQATVGSAAASDYIKAMLEYFRHTNTEECSDFLQRVCLLCEGIPMHLESKIMSVAGNACTKKKQKQSAKETAQETPHGQRKAVKLRASLTRKLIRVWQDNPVQ
ncbi:hypothetical protein AMECASPLE_037541 [Ameca splendens]|uniref:Uncharacterized protein n=1 Tax=Ameca splendens TaxID=208324 RepID=A0ABV1AFG9_9TELE